jgi:hypothetical protein
VRVVHWILHLLAAMAFVVPAIYLVRRTTMAIASSRRAALVIGWQGQKWMGAIRGEQP